MGHLMFTKSFWKGALERAIRTFCQTLVAVVGASKFDWMSADWQTIVATSAIATGLSVLTSIAGVNIGEKGSSSLVADTRVMVAVDPKAVPNPEGL